LRDARLAKFIGDLRERMKTSECNDAYRTRLSRNNFWRWLERNSISKSRPGTADTTLTTADSFVIPGSLPRPGRRIRLAISSIVLAISRRSPWPNSQPIFFAHSVDLA
jgi:hypothetical protein